MAAPAYLFAAGALNLAQNAYTAKDRRARYNAAESDFNRAKSQYMNQDLSNPMLNMENAYEDLTVNQQEANFIADQQNQGLANTMNAMSGAAGASGIAGLAQAMANQQSQNAIQAGARIGQQEARNQALAAQGAMSIQNMERQGEMYSRAVQRNQFSTELGMAQRDFANARAERAAAIDQSFKAFGQGISGGFGYMENMTSAFGRDNLLGEHMTGLFGNAIAKTGGGTYGAGENG